MNEPCAKCGLKYTHQIGCDETGLYGLTYEIVRTAVNHVQGHGVPEYLVTNLVVEISDKLKKVSPLTMGNAKRVLNDLGYDCKF